MTAFDVEVKGLRELEARLLELDALAAQKLLRRAARRSMIQLERQATSNAESFARSGALAESIKIVNVKPKGNETVAVQVGPKKKDRRAVALQNIYYGRKRKGIFYGHLVEFDRGVRGISGRRVSGKPWFTPAWNSTKSGIVPEFQKILAQGLARIAKRKRQAAAKPEESVDP